MSSVLKITYGGAEASCLLLADATAGTLTAKIGDAGSESEDANFGTAGVIDLSADAENLSALVTVIDAYEDYSAELYSGDVGADPETVIDQTVQAAGGGYLLFEPTSVLSDYALISWERAQSMLGYQDDERTKAERIINAITALVEGGQYAARKIVARDYDIYLPGTGSNYLILPAPPINSVASIYVDSSRAFGSDSELTSEYYDLDDAAGILYRFSGIFPAGRKTVKIAYNGGYGYGSEDIPEDLQFASLEALSWNMKRLGSSSLGLKSQSAEGVATEYELTIPVSAQRVFESYRDVRV